MYDARSCKYYGWCRDRNVNPSTAFIMQVASFLQELFDKEVFCLYNIWLQSSYFCDTLRFQRNSIRAGSRFETVYYRNDSFETTKEISSSKSWSLPLVLNTLIKEPFKPMDKFDIKFVTLKTAFLLAVVLGRRVNGIHALSIIDEHHLQWEGNYHGVILRTNLRFLAKNESLRNPDIVYMMCQVLGELENIVYMLPQVLGTFLVIKFYQ